MLCCAFSCLILHFPSYNNPSPVHAFQGQLHKTTSYCVEHKPFPIFGQKGKDWSTSCITDSVTQLNLQLDAALVFQREAFKQKQMKIS